MMPSRKKNGLIVTFGMESYNPDKAKVSKKGIRVTSIQYIPEALKLVMRKNGVSSDFKPIGDLSLKPWFANDIGLKLPKKLSIPVVKAIEPYCDEIEVVMIPNNRVVASSADGGKNTIMESVPISFDLRVTYPVLDGLPSTPLV